MSSINDGESSGSTSSSTALSAMLDWTSIILELQEKSVDKFEASHNDVIINTLMYRFAMYHIWEFFKKLQFTNTYKKKRKERERESTIKKVKKSNIINYYFYFYCLNSPFHSSQGRSHLETLSIFLR